MNERLREIVEAFQSVDAETRLELLLDYSGRLPELPAHLRAARDAGLNRIHECMTPVYLFAEHRDGDVWFHADVANEAPTVRGFVSLVLDAVNGCTPELIQSIPNDLVDQLALGEVLRMNRSVGLSAVLTRMKSEAAHNSPSHSDRAPA